MSSIADGSPATTDRSAATNGPVRRFRAWSMADRLAIGAELNAAHRRWADNWPPIAADGFEHGVVVDSADEVADLVGAAEWRRTGVEGIAWSMCRATGDTAPRALLMSALFDESSAPVSISGEPRLSEQLVEEAWCDWWCEIGKLTDAPGARAEDLASAAPASALRDAVKRFGGVLLARLPWCGPNTLMLLVEPDCVEALLRRPDKATTNDSLESAKTTAVLDALAPCRWSLDVELQPVEIELGSLTGLRLGDVLLTDHRLDQLLSVNSQAPESAARSDPLCRAFLGRNFQWRAVELRQADLSPSS